VAAPRRAAGAFTIEVSGFIVSSLPVE
jgi:hypothetical protein